LLAPLVDIGLTRAIGYDAERLRVSLELNSRVMRLWPTWDVSYRQAILLAMAGKHEDSLQIWRQARRGFPQQQDQFLVLLESLAAEGKPGVAELRNALRAPLKN
jgi:hypothetical protein